MKIAVTGKGGVGKTTISAGLARAFARKGRSVIALDMDPAPNLLSSLGCGEDVNIDFIRPLMEMSDLIHERTGAPPEGYGLVFKINPKVDDILNEFGIKCSDDVRLLVLGTIKRGGEGCFCPANALARALINHLAKNVDILMMDMEAGVEHLGRGTTKTVEVLLIVVEPSLKSVQIAKRIKELAYDLGIQKVYAVINKVKNLEEQQAVSELLQNKGVIPIFSIPYSGAMIKADLSDTSVFDLKESERLFKKIDELSGIIQNKVSRS